MDTFTPIFVLLLTWNLSCCYAVHKCKPRKSLVSTCMNGDSFVPPFVELHRCQGGLNNPHSHHCQAKRTEKIATTVIDFTGKKHIVQLENHLQCEEVCVCGNCGKKKSQAICEQGYVWDESRCRCICTCALGNNVKNERTKNTPDSRNITTTQLLLVMMAEFFAICVLFIVVQKSIRYYKQTKQPNISNRTNTVLYNKLRTVSYNSLGNDKTSL